MDKLKLYFHMCPLNRAVFVDIENLSFSLPLKIFTTGEKVKMRLKHLSVKNEENFIMCEINLFIPYFIGAK
jgi:hypothetical protein